jgi:hypothetical protein
MRWMTQKLHEHEVSSLRQIKEEVLVQLEQEKAAHNQLEQQHREAQEKYEPSRKLFFPIVPLIRDMVYIDYRNH